MKRFILKLLIFLCVVVVLDQLCGRVLGILYKNSSSNYPAKNLYLVNESKDDVVIYGSSRAFRHYNPISIGEESSLSVFNAGVPGNGIVYAYGLYKATRDRHKPKVALVDVFYEYDLRPVHDNTRFIDLLKPFYAQSTELQEYFVQIDPWTKVTMNSMLFRYNSQVFSILKSQRNNGLLERYRGFEPLEGSTPAVTEERTLFHMDTVVDVGKTAILEEMIRQMKNDGVKVVLLFSPIWHYIENSVYRDTVASIAQRAGVEFWDYLTTDSLSRSDFYDLGHLNSEGADRYSRMVGRRLKEKILEWQLVEE